MNITELLSEVEKLLNALDLTKQDLRDQINQLMPSGSQVTTSAVANWFAKSVKSKPGGEPTLALIEWVNQNKRKTRTTK